MEFKFSKGGENNSQAGSVAEKKKQSALLVLLLLLVGGFSYVYFFTGIIKSDEVLKPVEAPVAAPIVKMPLPPRDGDSGKTDLKAAVVSKEPAVPVKSEPPKDQAAPIAVVAPAAKAAAQPPPKPKEEPKKIEAVKPVVKPVVAEKKPVAAVKKAESAKTEAKKVSVVVAPKSKALPAEPGKPVKAAAELTGAGSSWSILVGSYVIENALSADIGRVRKAGLDPVIKPGDRKKSSMNRLFLSEFTDSVSAKAALDKLKRLTSDAFIVGKAGKQEVYAGSYLLDARAASEMERLRAAGFPVSLVRIEIAIPSQALTVGPFKDKKAADEALGKLKAVGVNATLSKQ